MTVLFSLFYWTFFGVSSVVLFGIALLLWLVTLPFDPTRRLLHCYTCWWSALYVRCLPGCWLVVEGREKIVPAVAYVLAANHQSLSDVMALGALAVRFKWVSKKEVFRIPCIGWNMYLNQYVAVDRGSVRNVRRTLTQCKDWLKRGVSLMVFPEGTRSKDGAIHEFHTGAFKVAAACGVAVAPIVVDGTFPIYRGWKVLPFPGRVTIRVLDPVTIDEAGGKVDQFRDLVYQRMHQELAQLRKAKQLLDKPAPVN